MATPTRPRGLQNRRRHYSLVLRGVNPLALRFCVAGCGVQDGDHAPVPSPADKDRTYQAAQNSHLTLDKPHLKTDQQRPGGNGSGVGGVGGGGGGIFFARIS